ncbi:MAG: gamma-glutamylcyclotransferase [Proteobacteria bacterium]|jgi:cation transport regulator ChaC|nr:gamma-glutamylcyclotransferase [Pseudomonadota bacterium]MDA0957683.1 gamma-glutamylcyclotransferase [Pseudomonadota bacterium]MDA1207795.1 gamma-glutamylcyclotransferase [Pseudomonadota bacterium]
MTETPKQQYYFAYGSNMNAERVRSRGMPFTRRVRARLKGYKLRFNKRAKNIPGCGHANVVASPEGFVEGILYSLPDARAIEMMDPFEGYPVRYNRERLAVEAAEHVAVAWVYIANPEYVQEGLKPSEDYLAHLLAGDDLLTPEYVAALQAIEVHR